MRISRVVGDMDLADTGDLRRRLRDTIDALFKNMAATEADADAALIDALQTLSTGEAASEVAKALGLNRKTLYRRALELKGK